MLDDEPRDFLERARSIASTVMFAAGSAAMIGSVLDWVNITQRARLVTNTTFGQDQVEAPPHPFTGLQAHDGWWTLVMGALLIAAAILIVLKARSGWGWVGFLASVTMGAITIADYRDIGSRPSPLLEQMNAVGGSPALGITLVAAASLIGLVASVAAVAATPRSAG